MDVRLLSKMACLIIPIWLVGPELEGGASTSKMRQSCSDMGFFMLHLSSRGRVIVSRSDRSFDQSALHDSADARIETRNARNVDQPVRRPWRG